jgi:hypothetical protein
MNSNDNDEKQFLDPTSIVMPEDSEALYNKLRTVADKKVIVKPEFAKNMNSTSAFQDNEKRLQRLEEQMADVRGAVLLLSASCTILSGIYIWHIMH